MAVSKAEIYQGTLARLAGNVHEQTGWLGILNRVALNNALGLCNRLAPEAPFAKMMAVPVCVAEFV